MPGRVEKLAFKVVKSRGTFWSVASVKSSDVHFFPNRPALSVVLLKSAHGRSYKDRVYAFAVEAERGFFGLAALQEHLVIGHHR